jgi:cobalt/nickel transport system permease protein
MHLGEGLLPARHAALWTAAALPSVLFGLRQLRGDDTVRAGLAAALIFAVTLFPIPVPVVGMTSHMCATPLLAILYGPVNIVVPTALVLLLEALLFAHGGITTWGANVVTLGIVGPIAGYAVWQLLGRTRLGCGPRVALACLVGDLAVYVADAAILGWALGGAEGAALWSRRLVLALAPAQVPLALLEGLLSGWLAVALIKSGRWQPAREARVGPAASHVLGGGGATLLVLVAFLVLPSACTGSRGGLDDVVFAAAGAGAGRPSRSLVDLSGGDLGRAFYGGAMLLAGLALGHAWGRTARTDQGENDAHGSSAPGAGEEHGGDGVS